ncbi:MAG: formyltransferase family protein [Oscillospiraceae bacterium]|nr:formyltransferase family protein [Oscillospiraceae bacterium]
MVRTAFLVAGNGAKLQSILDSVYFGEIPNFELTAVLSPDPGSYALTRARNAGVPAFVVEPADFPTKMSYSLAISNKLKDMDIDLVVLDGYNMPLGVVSTQFKNRLMGVCPSLIPAFENFEGDAVRAALERGCKTTGATVYFLDPDGNVGPIVSQQAVDVLPGDSVEALSRRILEEAEWKLLPKALALYCEGRLKVRGSRTVII